MEALTLSPRTLARRGVRPRSARTTHEIAICDCPVCRLMGARRLLSAFAVYQRVLADQPRRPIDLKVRRQRLPGVCTSGPNILVDGRLMKRIHPTQVRSIVRDLVKPSGREDTSEERSPRSAERPASTR